MHMVMVAVVMPMSMLTVAVAVGTAVVVAVVMRMALRSLMTMTMIMFMFMPVIMIVVRVRVGTAACNLLNDLQKVQVHHMSKGLYALAQGPTMRSATSPSSLIVFARHPVMRNNMQCMPERNRCVVLHHQRDPDQSRQCPKRTLLLRRPSVRAPLVPNC